MNPEEEQQRTQDQINDAEWQNPDNWRWGLFYYGPRDSRAWVPKRSLFGRRRYGGTPNFAHPGGRSTMMVVVGLMVIVFLFIVWLERLGVLR